MENSNISLLNTIFHRAVYRWPDRVALVCEGEQWTYQELYNKSLQYAACIRALHGQAQNACIAIYGTKSLETTAVILGVLLAGLTYMPLDINLPAERIVQTLNIARPLSLITTTLNTYLKKQLKEIQYKFHSCDLKSLQAVSISGHNPEDFINSFNPESIAYLLFTSGSTGVPKGVCVSHRAAVSAIGMLFEHVHLEMNDKIANQSPFCYDLSMFDIFSAFCVGASVHLLPPHIVKVPNSFMKYVIEHKLSSLFIVNSALEYLLKHATENSEIIPLKTVLLTGDPISENLIRLLSENLSSNCKIWNLYSAVEMPYAFAQTIDVNKPLHNSREFNYYGSKIKFYLDEKYKDDSANIGALVVESDVLYSGYINVDNTIEDMKNNPIKIYHTRDWVRLAESGIELFGRIDRQVKIMGNRVELDDIEANLERFPMVQEAAIIFDHDNQRVTAFITLKDKNGDQVNALKLLRQLCQKKLPSVMHPHDYIILSEIPRTTSGKKDRTLLARQLFEHHAQLTGAA